MVEGLSSEGVRSLYGRPSNGNSISVGRRGSRTARNKRHARVVRRKSAERGRNVDGGGNGGDGGQRNTDNRRSVTNVRCGVARVRRYCGSSPLESMESMGRRLETEGAIEPRRARESRLKRDAETKGRDGSTGWDGGGRRVWGNGGTEAGAGGQEDEIKRRAEEKGGKDREM